MQDQLAASNLQALNSKSFEIKFDLSGTGYEAVENIGTGAYGVVCSALNLNQNGEKVAIKKISDIFGQSTVAMRTYREIKILKHFRHDNIISIREILRPRDEDLLTFRDVYIVLDLMESDLHRIIHSKQELTDEHIRYFLYQILRGLKYIHSANVLHRDLKPSNLLVNENCLLKIGDFGMARGISSSPGSFEIKLTQYVATRWYRAPELMLLPLNYTAAVDMWSVGCIFAEMLGRKQLFPGQNYRQQLSMVFEVVGTPSEDYINLTSQLIREFLLKTPKKPATNFKQLYPLAHPKAIRLLERMLKLDPTDRISVEGALADLYLNKYHDVDDEPICIPAFDFSFEREKLDPDALRKAITKEIMDFHQPKLKDITIDLRHVPIEELQQARSSSNPASRPETMSADIAESRIFDLDAEKQLKKSPLTAINQTSTQTTSDLAVRTRECLSDSVEMLSASLPKLSIEQQPSDLATTVAPPAAVSISGSNDIDISPSNVTTTTVSPTGGDSESSLVDAKARIKAALLNSERRRQQIELGQMKPSTKAVTALQRQKEREEKRRRKQERARERKKTQQHKETKIVSPQLTEDDRKQLERWQSMAQTKRAARAAAVDSSSKAGTNVPSMQTSKRLPGPTAGNVVHGVVGSYHELSPVQVHPVSTAAAAAGDVVDAVSMPVLRSVDETRPSVSAPESYRRHSPHSWHQLQQQQNEPVSFNSTLDATQLQCFPQPIGGLGDLVDKQQFATPMAPVLSCPVNVLPFQSYYGTNGLPNPVADGSAVAAAAFGQNFFSSSGVPGGGLIALNGVKVGDNGLEVDRSSEHAMKAGASVVLNPFVNVIGENIGLQQQQRGEVLDRSMSQQQERLVDLKLAHQPTAYLANFGGAVLPDRMTELSAAAASSSALIVEQGPSLTVGSFEVPQVYRPANVQYAMNGLLPLQRYDCVTEASCVADGSFAGLSNAGSFQQTCGFMRNDISNGSACPSLGVFDQSTAMPFSVPFDGLVQRAAAAHGDRSGPNLPSSEKPVRFENLTVDTSVVLPSVVNSFSLLSTPKGSAVGYGLGETMDSYGPLFSASVTCVDMKSGVDGSESAPLSASLMADWRYVMGDMDSSELEAVLRAELQDLGSPSITFSGIS